MKCVQAFLNVNSNQAKNSNVAVKNSKTWNCEKCRTLVATICANGMNVFAWMEGMSEAVARDCQVSMWMDKKNLLVAGKTCECMEISEQIACEQRKANGGH